MTREDEIKVRDMIKSTLDKEIKKEREDAEKKLSKLFKDNEKTQKDEFLSSLKKEVDSMDKKFLTKQEIKDLLAKAFMKQHKFMWEKSKFITTYFNDL